jgi:hypothetical protein
VLLFLRPDAAAVPEPAAVLAMVEAAISIERMRRNVFVFRGHERDRTVTRTTTGSVMMRADAHLQDLLPR